MSTLSHVVLENPFPGLRPFQQGEEHLFFGRESQVDRMVDKLAAGRFLSVVGNSGSGKSSLVNCGLLPALHRGSMAKAGTSWCVVRFRPGGEPIRSMTRAFAGEDGFAAQIPVTGIPLADVVEITLNMSSLGIAELFELGRFQKGTNLLVYVDQFEELFRYQRAAEQAAPAVEVSGKTLAFINLLLEARAQTTYPIYIVLTMRSDFLGDCSQFDRLPEVINEGQYLVPRLTREERRQAIAGPMAVAGAELSPVLLTRLVNDVGDNPDQLSIMQHAMNRTWAYWQNEGSGQGALSLEHYENAKVGTMAHALDLHAEEAYAELKTRGEVKICEKIFKALTDKATDARGIRRPLQLARLSRVVGAEPEAVTRVLNVFREPSRSFLMPPRGDILDAATVIDISHEILMRVWDRLRNWSDEEALSAATYRHIAETAERHRAGYAGLWADPNLPDLKSALEWQAKQEPNEAWAALYHPAYEVAQKFLDDSKSVRDLGLANVELERRWRKLRPFLMGAVLALYVMVSPTISRLLQPRVSPVAEVLFHHNVTSGASKGSQTVVDISQLVSNGFGFQFFAVICVGGYAGLAWSAKRIHRRLAFATILREISNPKVWPQRSSVGGTEHSTDSGMATELSETLIPASFWRILCAGVVDFVISLLMDTVVFFVMVLLCDHLHLVTTEHGLAILGGWILIFPFLYAALMTSSRIRGTVGDRLLGIWVTDLNGLQPSFARALARYVASILSWIVFGMGFLLQLFGSRRSLHDYIAGTMVMRREQIADTPTLAAEVSRPNQS